MDAKGTLQVIKRDGSLEPFNSRKLAGSMYRAMTETSGRYRDAADLAGAIRCHLDRSATRCIASRTLLEMCTKVLRRVRMNRTAWAMEAWDQWRTDARGRMAIRHRDGSRAQWEKGWAAKLLEQTWQLAPETARILAGRLEEELIRQGASEVHDEDAMAMVNAEVAAVGLADAVPLRDAHAD